jgi:hypothetical protein
MRLAPRSFERHGVEATSCAQREGGATMEQHEEAITPREAVWRSRSTTELMREVAAKTSLLVGKEVELARTELKNDVVAELVSVKSFAVAAVGGICTLNLLLVGAAVALMGRVGGWWQAIGIVAGVTLVIALVAALVGWRAHVSRPLARTRKTLKEDVQWAKEELA